MRLARVLARLQSLAQGGELLGDHTRESLQLARGLQCGDARADLRRQPEADEQGEAHQHGEESARSGGEQPAVAICAFDFHVDSLTA